MTEKHGLAATLDQLVKRAEAHPGLPVRQTLSKGLRVDVMVQDGQTHLQISRDGKWPSPAEWSIVTRDFPQAVPKDIAPRRLYDKGRYYLKAQWETIVEEQAELQGMKAEG